MEDHPHPDPAPPTSGAEWLRRYEELQRRVTRFSAVEQGLINTRDLLDRELERFNRMHLFNTRAIRANSAAEFPDIVAEAIVDVFELEFGCLWLVDAEGGWHARPVGVTGLRADPAALKGFTEWLGRQCAEGGDEPRLIAGPELEGLRTWVPATQLVVAGCRDSAGRALGWLAGGVTDEQAEFYRPVRSEHLGSFRVFAQQASALIQNRRDRIIIQRQYDCIEVSEERLSLALEASRAGLWDWDIVAGRGLYSNQWLAILGYAPGALTASLDEWRDRLHPEDRATVLTALEAHIAGRTDHYEQCFRMQHREGHYVWIQSRGRVLRDADGRPYRMVGTHLDVSAQKALERRLREAEEAQRQAREQAESANRAKSVFLANMSHEIRTPLNGVSVALQLLRQSPIEPRQEQLVEAAEQSSRTLLRLLGDILDLSKIEAGKLELDAFAFDLSATLREAVSASDLLAREKGLTLAVTLAPGVPATVHGDATRLSQVLTNLVGNAVKFTAQGGVWITVETIPPGPVIGFSVRDTGIGMSAEVQAGLFTPFVQADSSTTRRFGGTGLGLAISRLLVEMMGGRITVRSEPGQGAEFRFEIPLPEAPRSAIAPAPSTDAAGVPSVRSGRMLIAEDDRISRELAVLVVEGMGLEVTAVANGREAVERFQAAPYDLVLLDCNMPEMDGYEACRAMRAIEAQRPEAGGNRARIIALTANVLVGERERCLQAGMDEYLTKPLAATRLAAMLGTPPGAGPEPAPAVPESALTRLNQLCEELDPAMVRQLVADFLQDLPARIEELGSLHERRQFSDLERMAHSLKGVCLSFGLAELADTTRAVEHAAGAPDPRANAVPLDRAIAAVPGAGARAANMLRAWLGARGSSAESARTTAVATLR